MKKVVYIVLGHLLISGCASMGKYDNNKKIYPLSATITDTAMIYCNMRTGKPEGELPDPFDFLYSPYMIPFYIIDLPFSVVTDIITFPFDLYWWLTNQPIKNTRQENYK